MASFGQDSSIRALVHGYAPPISAHLHDHLDEMLDRMPPAPPISDEHAGDDPDDYVHTSAPLTRQQAHRSLSSALEQAGGSHFLWAALDTVSALPRLQLARVAEQLVQVQALGSFLARGVPTVGGDIEVAVITRRDGVQWVRRVTAPTAA